MRLRKNKTKKTPKGPDDSIKAPFHREGKNAQRGAEDRTTERWKSSRGKASTRRQGMERGGSWYLGYDMQAHFLF